jgi:hypothetical protein
MINIAILLVPERREDMGSKNQFSFLHFLVKVSSGDGLGSHKACYAAENCVCL